MSKNLRGELGEKLKIRQTIQAHYGAHAIEEHMHRFCIHCTHWDHTPPTTAKRLTICDRLLIPLTQDGSGCPYFTESKPEVPFVPED